MGRERCGRGHNRRGTAASPCSERERERAKGLLPSPLLPLGGTLSTGRADSEHRLTGERQWWDAPCLGAAARPRRRAPAQAAPRQEAADGAAPQAGSHAPCRVHPGPVIVVIAALPAPVGSPLGWAPEPDPLCGRRVSIRPQPRRAPRRGGGTDSVSDGDHNWTAAGGPTPGWGGGGMPWDPAAAALRLSLALDVARGVSGSPPPPPRHPGTVVAAGRVDGAHRLTRDGLGRSVGQRDATPPPPPPPPAPTLAPLQPATILFCPWHGGQVDGAEGEGAGNRARPPPTPVEPPVAPWPRSAAVARPGNPEVPHPLAAPRVGQHHLCPRPPQRATPWGPAPPGSPRRGVESVVSHPPPARGRPCLVVRRPGPRCPRVQAQGGHRPPGAAVEVPPRPLCARPPPNRQERRPPLHVALVSGATVVGGDRCADEAADTAWPGGAFGPTRVLAPPPVPHLTLFEGETAAGGPHAVAEVGGAGCGTTTPPAPPPPSPDPDPSATWREMAAEVHALLLRLSDVWWATLLEPEEVRATARWLDVLRRVPPAPNRDFLHEVAREADRLAEGWEHGRPPRLPAPPLPLAASGPLPPSTPPPPPPGTPILGR